MKKHIIGLTLFSLIVSAAAIVYAVFNVPDIILRPTKLSSPAEKTSCRFQQKIEQEINSPKIMQAVYEVKTNTLKWQVTSLDLNKPTIVHWFIESEKGIENVHTILSVSDLTNELEISPQSELGKMLKKNPKSNQYLIIDTDLKFISTNELNGTFDLDKGNAIPVTIDYGK